LSLQLGALVKINSKNPEKTIKQNFATENHLNQINSKKINSKIKPKSSQKTQPKPHTAITKITTQVQPFYPSSIPKHRFPEL
jgi:hypothetical protein